MTSTFEEVPVFPEPRAAVPGRPFPGLRPFREDEWRIFFGREIMVDEVITRLVERNLVFVHGGSGSGKSSLIHAGLLPALKARSTWTSYSWRTCFAQPGQRPIDHLVDAFAALLPCEKKDGRFALRRALAFGPDAPAEVARLIDAAPGKPVCLLLDQFEEIFTQVPADLARDVRHVVDFLVALAAAAESTGLYVVVTMRTEYLGACATYKDFAETVNETQYLLPRMKRAELLRAIEEPARMFGGEVERALANCLVAETSEMADQLPLIQHGLALMLGENVPASDWKLTLDSYAARASTLSQMLSDHADKVADAAAKLAHPRRPDTPVVERIFKALSEVGSNGSAVRRPQTLAQLERVTGESRASLQAVLKPFRAEGVAFLRPFGNEDLRGEDVLDLAHESVVRCWRRAAEPSTGWMAQEFRDGQAWRILLAQLQYFRANPANLMSRVAAQNGRLLIRSHNEVWSERYGGQWTAVEGLLEASLQGGLQTSWERRLMFGAFAVAIASLLLAAGVLFVRDQITEVAQDETYRATGLARKNQVEAQQQAQSLATRLEAVKVYGETHRDEKLIALASTNQGVAARVDIAVSDPSQLAAAKAVADRISKLEFRGQSIAVSHISVIPSMSHDELRCFFPKDCDEGAALRDKIQALLSKPNLDLQPKRFVGAQGTFRPGHYELLFKPGAIEQAPGAPSKEDTKQ